MHRIGFIVCPGYSVMTFAAISAFEVANLVARAQIYEVSVLSEKGGSVRTSVGVTVETTGLVNTGYETLIVGGETAVATPPADLIAFLQREAGRCRRIAAFCTGAFVLAEAGLLNGRRATTHWFFARDLKSRFPEIKVDEDRIFINDGPVWTSAGMTAGIDLSLAMIESDLGAEVARRVARALVIYHRRGGGQSQFSALLELQPKSDRIQTALDYAKRNLHSVLSVGRLAEVAHLSPRQFSRAFQAETGQSPAKAIEQLRVEAARLMLEQGRHSLDEIADQTGFADRDRMRRAFLRAFGQPPQAIRRNAREELVS